MEAPAMADQGMEASVDDGQGREGPHATGPVLGTLDVRILRSIPTPVADSLAARGCRTAGDVLRRPQALKDSLSQLHVRAVEQKSSAMLSACRQEATSAWGSADSALDLLQIAQARQPLRLPCAELGELLGGALRPGGGLLEVAGMPGSGKTQFCLQVCAAAQIGAAAELGGDGSFAEAVYLDTEGSFVPRRYAQVCQALLQERGEAAAGQAAVEAVLRTLHVCRAYDAAELYATVKQLGGFLRARPRIRALVIDSIAFCFRHEFTDNTPQRTRLLTDIAATLRNYGAEHGLTVVVTNHMTTKFDRTVMGEEEKGWLAPALGETWAHQPNTQLRLERLPQGPSAQSMGRATLTKSVEQATGRSCLYRIAGEGIRDAEVQSAVMGQESQVHGHFPVPIAA